MTCTVNSVSRADLTTAAATGQCCIVIEYEQVCRYQLQMPSSAKGSLQKERIRKKVNLMNYAIGKNDESPDPYSCASPGVQPNNNW